MSTTHCKILLTSTLLNVSILSLLLAAPSAQAGPNDFFGSTLPTQGADSPQAQAVNSLNASPSNADPIYPGTDPSANSPSAVPSDFTADEKDQQKKYKKLIKHYQGLIEKGDKMIKQGKATSDNKMASKGRVLKEVGEKHLAEMKANNPLPDAPKPMPEKKEPDQ